jgi:nucleoside-diphosphate-sugar epimerase
MESICATSKNFTIFRLPQVVGKTSNPHTLTNFLFHKIKTRSRFKLRKNAYRSLIDVDDVVSMVVNLDAGCDISRATINLAPPYLVPVLEIVRIFELVLGVRAVYDIVENGSFYEIKASNHFKISEQSLINFDEKYTERLIRKYYEK